MAVRIYREPIERDRRAGVTIREIEERVRALNPAWTQAIVEAASLLFAILKEGCSTQKLRAFTRYPSEFLMDHVEHLRSRGELFTGTLSTRYVLHHVPGSEELIEKITGQRIVQETTTHTHKAPAGYDWQRHLKASPIAAPARPAGNFNGKEESTMSTSISGADEGADNGKGGEDTCGKSEVCSKPDGHTGRCKGAGGRDAKTRVPAERARRQPNSRADSPKLKASKPAKSYTDARASRTATAAVIDPGHFKIEFEDGTETISIEGVGREAFAGKLKMLYESFAGGSNG